MPLKRCRKKYSYPEISVKTCEITETSAAAHTELTVHNNYETALIRCRSANDKRCFYIYKKELSITLYPP